MIVNRHLSAVVMIDGATTVWVHGFESCWEQLRKHKLLSAESMKNHGIMVWLQFKWAWVRYVKHILRVNCKLQHVEKQWTSDECWKSIVVTIDEMLRTCFNMVIQPGHYKTCYDVSLQSGHYKLATTRPLQSRHNPRSLQIHYNDGHYEFATTMVTTNCYNMVTTTSPQPGLYDLCHNPGHYEFTTTRSLQTHYNIFTITPLQ